MPAEKRSAPSDEELDSDRRRKIYKAIKCVPLSTASCTTDLLSSSSYTDTISLSAGKGTPFTVHEDLICRHSQLVNSVLSKTPDEKTIQLEYIPAGDMQFYIDWLYTKKPDLASQIKTYIEVCNANFSSRLVQELRVSNVMCNLWITGDGLKDSGFKNHVINCLQAQRVLQTTTIPKKSIENIVKKTKPGSGLRRWLVDHLVGLSPADLELLGPLLSETVVRELLKKYVEGVDEGGLVTHWCKYHEHAEGEGRCKVKIEQREVFDIKDEE